MISVIVPVYSVQDYLDECLNSIINQTYKNLEIICVDDCTLDNSVNIVKRYMRVDPRIRLINNVTNRGLGGARNAGISAARGEYISFIDSDDVIAPTMLEKLFYSIEKEKTDVSICGVYRFFDNSDEVINTFPFHRISNLTSGRYSISSHKEYLINMWPSAWNKLYKTSVIKEFALSYQENLLYEDHFFFYNYFCRVQSFSYVNEPLYYYRSNRVGSITSSSVGREEEVFTVLESLEPIFHSYFDLESFNASYATVCFRLIWERQFALLNDLTEWKRYSSVSETWLLDHFDLNFLKENIDSVVSSTDMFYKFIFYTGFRRTCFRLKLLLKKYPIMTKFHTFALRLKHKLFH